MTTQPVADSARRARFEEVTGAAELDRYRRIQFRRPLEWHEMNRVQHLLGVAARRQRRLARERALRTSQVAF